MFRAFYMKFIHNFSYFGHRGTQQLTFDAFFFIFFQFFSIFFTFFKKNHVFFCKIHMWAHSLWHITNETLSHIFHPYSILVHHELRYIFLSTYFQLAQVVFGLTVHYQAFKTQNTWFLLIKRVQWDAVALMVHLVRVLIVSH